MWGLDFYCFKLFIYFNLIFLFGGFVYRSGRDDGGMAWDFGGLLLGGYYA